MATVHDRSVTELLEEISAHNHGDALAKLVHVLAFSAFDETRPHLEEGLANAAERLGLDEASSDTSWGNVIRALRKGATATTPERQLLGLLLARGVALSSTDGPQAEDRIVRALAWVAANTIVDGLAAIDVALVDPSYVWRSAARLLTLADEAALPRPSQVIVAAAIGASSAAAAVDEKARLGASLRDPLLMRLVGSSKEGSPSEPIVLAAELATPPRSPVGLVLLTITFILPLLAFAKLVGRYALHVKRPAELSVTDDGVTVQSRLELFGRTLRESKLHIPRAGLTRAARQVRYPRLATYAGIGTLLVGSYIGLRLVIDGARAGAPELLGIGSAVLLSALVLDYLLARIPSASKGRCELVFSSLGGRSIALGRVDAALADKALALLQRPVAASTAASKP